MKQASCDHIFFFKQGLDLILLTVSWVDLSKERYRILPNKIANIANLVSL